MRRLTKAPFIVFAFVIFTFPLLVTATAHVDSSGGTLARIKERGELILGTSGNMPSMTQVREDGKLVGFDIDMARLMAEGMGVKLKIMKMPFDKLLDALEGGDVDVVISNMTMNPRRNMRVAFVGPYLTSGKCIVTKNEPLAKAKERGNLNVPKTRLAALKGSTSAEFVKATFPKATLSLIDDYDVAAKMIIDDKVDGLLTDFPICQSVLKRNPDADFVSLFSLLTYEPIGIALPGNDPLFINWTENFLKRLEGTGLFKGLSKRWFNRENLVFK